MTSTTTASTSSAAGRDCDLPTRITKSLLGYGVIAGPFYVTVSLAQALTRHGFDLTRHPWSLLENGGLGWIQVANFVLTGLMTVAAAAGLRRAGTGRLAPALIGGYGASLILAGIFRADPALGFPAGAPAGTGTITWHGIGHLASGAIGFGCLIAACLLTGRALRRAGERRQAAICAGTGLALLVGFAAIASGSRAAVVTLGFTAAVVAAWCWLTALSIRRYREQAAG